MGDPSVEVTEEARDASQESKAQALEAISEGDAVQCLYVCMHFCVFIKSVGIMSLTFGLCAHQVS